MANIGLDDTRKTEQSSKVGAGSPREPEKEQMKEAVIQIHRLINNNGSQGIPG
jgi:hypothetical protein